MIEYKTKPYPVIQPDGTERQAVTWKKQLTRKDCTLRPHEHDYYNSDLFAAILTRAYRVIVGTSEWCYLDRIPAGVTVDTSKFLAVVTIPLAKNFR